MKVLIIDDNPAVVKEIRYFCVDNDWECEVVDFSDYSQTIYKFNPDVVVLDWKDDADSDNAGSAILDEIIKDNFRPVIVFSAIEPTIPEIKATKNKSLVYRFTKEDEKVVTDLLEKLNPFIISINDTRKQMSNALIESTKAIHNFIEVGTTPSQDIVKYMLNQRTSQFFNKELFERDNPPAWIQYEYPPVLEHFVVADILRKVSDEMDVNSIGKPEEYAIILTPTCDLARAKETASVMITTGGESRANFCKDFYLSKDEDISSVTGKSKHEDMRRLLTQGTHASKVAIPELKNKIPYMCFNLKKVEIVLNSEIAVNEFDIDAAKHKYYRIATINSPYREQLVWAYMNTACRPGVPERDYLEWAEGMISR